MFIIIRSKFFRKLDMLYRAHLKHIWLWKSEVTLVFFIRYEFTFNVDTFLKSIIQYFLSIHSEEYISGGNSFFHLALPMQLFILDKLCTYIFICCLHFPLLSISNIHSAYKIKIKRGVLICLNQFTWCTVVTICPTYLIIL